MDNSADSDQAAPLGAVLSGFALFALRISVRIITINMEERFYLESSVYPMSPLI